MIIIIVTLIRILRFLQLAVLLRVIWSWVDPEPRHPLVRTFIRFIDYLAKPFRVVVPYGNMALDLGPLLLMLTLEVVSQLIANLATVALVP